MRIAFDTFQPPRAPRRAVSAPTTASLISRIEKPPLAERISHDDSGVKIPSAPYVHSSCFLILSSNPYFFYPDGHSQEDPFATALLEAPTALDLLADPRKPRQLKNSTMSSMHSWATPT